MPMNALPSDLVRAAQELSEAVTRPIPGSRKIHVHGSRDDIQVPMRAIALDDTPSTFGTEKNAPFIVIQGIVTRISPSGHRTSRDVPFPAGLAVSTTGTLYVAAWSVSSENGLAGPGTSGQIWRMNW